MRTVSKIKTLMCQTGLTAFRTIGSLLIIMLLAFSTPACNGDDDDPDVIDEPALKLVAEGLTSPVTLAEAPDESGMIFIADQTGEVRVMNANGELQQEPFLDISDKIVPLEDHYDERGLLGLAFHPQYKTNGKFYVYYSAPLRPEAPDGYDHTSHLAEYQVSAADPLKANPGSERILLQVDQPQTNHNAGTLAFGPTDGNLYISIGDGGNRDDQGLGHVDDWYEANVGGNGQDITQNLLGDILRIDVNGGDPYGIPADNPFVGTEGMDEIYAYGFRNPYRFSFDMGGDHALYVGDAGQELYEEVSIVHKGGNYGWNVKEGTHCFDASSPENPPANCPETDPEGDPLIDPVIEFLNAKQSGGVGLVMVGGYVYRGDDLPLFTGRYIFGTWSAKHDSPAGKVFIATPEAEGLWDFEVIDFKNRSDEDVDEYVLGFGQDAEGEVYVLTTNTEGPSGNTGKVFKIVDEDEVEN